MESKEEKFGVEFFLEDLKAGDRIVISVVEFGDGRKGQEAEVGEPRRALLNPLAPLPFAARVHDMCDFAL